MSKDNEALRVLFVDDDKPLLSGLKRAIRLERREWQSHFCQNAREGLDLLGSTVVDVVVSDIRMPGMDGIEFLSRVKDLYPSPVRIIFSGHMGEYEGLKTIRPAHQFVAKPCPVEELLHVIERTCRYREITTDQSLLSVVNGIDSLPVLPDVYLEVTRALEDENVSMEDIGKIIGGDPSMGANILKTVNTPFFGIRREVLGVTQAVTLLGMETIRGLVLCEGLFRQFSSILDNSFSLKLLWEHSLRVAAMARAVAVHEGLSAREVDLAALAGLLHDLGKLVLVDKLPQEYAKVLEQVRTGSMDTRHAEVEVLGTSHAMLGAYLLGLWGSPEEIVYAVAYHHRPAQCPESSCNAFPILHAVNVFDHELYQIKKVDPVARNLDPDILERVGPERMDAWRAVCEQSLGGMEP